MSVLDRFKSAFAEAMGLVKQVDRLAADPVSAASSTTAQKEPEDDVDGYTVQSVWNLVDKELRIKKQRAEKYAEYDVMDDECPPFSSALDIFADNATGGDGEDVLARVQVHTDDAGVKKELTAMLERLNVSGLLWSYARDVAKYGERAAEVVVDEDFNVAWLKPLPTERIIPKFDKYGLPEKKAYVQIDDTGRELASFKKWQIVHFMLKQSASHISGTSIGAAARRPFKQLRMMETAIVVARLTRAHNKLAIGVDTGSLAPEEARKHVARIRAEMRKRRMFNARTGELDASWNPLVVEEDLFYGVSKESKADVKVLQGDLTVGNIDDVLYLQQSIFTALKVPKAYLANEKSTSDKGVLTEQDLQFARTVRRLQRAIVLGLQQICDLQLRLKRIDAKGGYRLSLPRISVVDELKHWQSEQLRMLVGRMMKQTFWPSDEDVLKWLGFDAEEIELFLKNQKTPDKFNGLYQAPKVGAVAGENSGDPNIDGKKS